MARYLVDRRLRVFPALFSVLSGRLLRFALVGASGLLINTAALLIAVEVIEIDYLFGVVLATQASTAWNFLLTEKFVFSADNARFAKRSRFGQFWLMNNGALAIRGPAVWLLTEAVGLHYASSNFLSLIIIMLVRYAIAERVIWGERGSGQRAEPLHPVPMAGGDSVFAFVNPNRTLPTMRSALTFLSISGIAILARTVYLNSLGLNSDEAVYAGQGASLAGDPVLIEYFPIFRAHPLLFQTTLSLVFSGGVSPLAARLTAACFGVATVGLCYLVGKQLYGRRAGLIAALILAVMPYHVVVTRQVLLDGPMVFFSTLSLYLVVRFVEDERSSMLYAAVAAMGLTFLTNERSIVLIGGIYLFFALSSKFVVTFRQIVCSAIVFVLMAIPYPLSVTFSGKSTTGEQFLAWQLFRRANHGLGFYFANLPPVLGWLTLLAVLGGMIALRKQRGWRETMLACWCVVPFAFFQVWPVKGFQYLLALAPVIAVAAGHSLARIPDQVDLKWPALTELQFPDRFQGVLRIVAVAVVAGSLALSTWGRISPAEAGDSFLAGSGGVPGGREAGEWVAANLPEGAELLAIGPSMANIIQWYGDRKTYGLSVSPNPLHRNPVYEPIVNPDLVLRNGDLHYLVWDSFSASRSEFFSNKLLVFAERYNGRIVHQQTLDVATDNGEVVKQPIIIVYEVRP